MVAPALRTTDAAHLRTWLMALSLGAVLGALMLGVGGRLAMRGITLWEGRPHLASAAGTLTVLGFGTIFGIAGGALRGAIAVLSSYRVPERVQGPVFFGACLVIALVFLTPLTMHRLIVFPPVVVVYALVFELCWLKWMPRLRRPGA
jgi:hypothetical protein